MFYVVPVIRIDPEAQATHLEVAASWAPPDTLVAFQDADKQRRQRATFMLAQHLAGRLGCFDITGNKLGGIAPQQTSLCQELPRALTLMQPRLN